MENEVKNKLISAELLAIRIGITSEQLKGHVCYTVTGNAEIPQRFWKYKAYTQEEVTQIIQRYPDNNLKQIDWKLKQREDDE